MRRRVLVAPVVLLALSSALTGCQPGLLALDDPDAPPVTGPSEEPTASAEETVEDPSVSPSSEGEPSEAPTQAPVGGGDAIGFTCEQVFTLEQLYDFDPNFTPADEPGRELPQVFVQIGDDEGIVCAYRHVTSEALLLVGVAPGDSGIEPGYTNEVGIGTTAATAGDYVVAVGSTYFGAAGDADSLIDQVTGNVTE